MELTNAQRKKIWLISDTILYPEAATLVRSIAENEKVKRLPKTSQVMGLFDIAETSKYSNITDYIKNKIEREVDQVFYEQVLQALNKMYHDRLQKDFQFVTLQDMKQTGSAKKDELMLLLAREFIKHIVAEHGMMKLTEKKRESYD